MKRAFLVLALTSTTSFAWTKQFCLKFATLQDPIQSQTCTITANSDKEIGALFECGSGEFTATLLDYHAYMVNSGWWWFYYSVDPSTNVGGFLLNSLGLEEATNSQDAGVEYLGGQLHVMYDLLSFEVRQDGVRDVAVEAYEGPCARRGF